MVMKIKKAEGTKVFRNLKFKDYNNCLEANQLENEINLQSYIGVNSLMEND